MTDYVHLKNIIGGAVIQIRERRPLDQQSKLLNDLHTFLHEQAYEVAQINRQVCDEMSEALRKQLETPTKDNDDD